MAKQFERVKRGDLITAELMNDIMDEIEELDERITALESSGGPVNLVSISGFYPEEEVEVKRELKIYGTNFKYPPNLNSVTIDGEDVITFLSPCSSRKLRVIVPDTIVVPVDGKPNVPVRIENDLGSTEENYPLILPSTVTGDSPIIDSITHDDGGATLIINEYARINGSNFPVDPLNNNISIIYDAPNVGEVTYTVSDIDVVSSDLIRFLVPDIQELTAGPPQPATVELVVGDFPPVTKPVSIKR